MKKILLGLLTIVLMFSVARAVYFDGDNDGWLTLTGECDTLWKAGVPLNDPCADFDICMLCGDINGDPVWCAPNCTFMTDNYAIYLTTGEKHYDGDNDGWIVINSTTECNAMLQASVPVECVEGMVCPICYDANFNKVWCTSDCKVSTGNYAEYKQLQEHTGDAYYDENYDGKITIDSYQLCNAMFQAGVPMPCLNMICPGCLDEFGDEVWCSSNCTVTVGNYAIYLSSVDDVYPKIITQIPLGSTRVTYANSYPISGSDHETFTVTYNETNLAKVMLFWREYTNSTFNNITLSNCNAGESETCSIDLDLSMYPDHSIIAYTFVVYDVNSCSLDPMLVGDEESCEDGYGLPNNCLKGFETPPGCGGTCVGICFYDIGGNPIIQGNTLAPPDTDYLAYVSIDRTPPTTTTTTTTTTTSTTSTTTTSTTTSTSTTTTTTTSTTTTTIPVFVELNSPENKTYDTKYVRLNFSASKKFESIKYSDNSQRFSILCRNCQSYDRRRTFNDGQHNLTVCGIDDDKQYCDSVLFFVDSKKPIITTTYPRRNNYATGTFTINYYEKYLQNITLYYGKDKITRYDCPSGNNEECIFDVSLSSYEGQEIQYNFTVCDSVRCTPSKSILVKVDTIAPVITIFKPTEEAVYGRYVPINISLTEKANYLKYSDNGGRFSTLCSRCNSYDRTKYFNRGYHNVTFMAVDEAGNENYKSVTFNVEY